MKKFSFIIRLFLMLLVCIGIASASDVYAAEYAEVDLSGLSEGENFYARYSGVQYKKTLYYYNVNTGKIMTYTNRLASKGKEPGVFASEAESFLLSGKYLMYTDTAKKLHVYNLSKKKDSVICGNAYSVCSFDGKAVCYCEAKTREYRYIDIKGRSVAIENVQPEEPSFTKTSQMKKVKMFCAGGVWYAGAKLTTGRYALFMYNGDSFAEIVPSTKVDTTACYELNGTPCFLRKNSSGKTVLYRLENNRLVKAGSFSRDALFDYEGSCILVDDGFLVIISMDEYSDHVRIFDEYFNLLFDSSVFFSDEGYFMDIRDGILYLDAYVDDDEYDEEQYTITDIGSIAGDKKQ